jgi:hypothetical protein
MLTMSGIKGIGLAGLLYLLCLLCCGTSYGVWGLEIPVVGVNISEVMVVGNLAEVTRSFVVRDVQVGQHSLVIKIPEAANEQSLSIKGTGLAEV